MHFNMHTAQYTPTSEYTVYWAHMSVRRTVITFKYELTVGALKKCEWNLLNIVNWKLDMVLSIAWGNYQAVRFDRINFW